MKFSFSSPILVVLCWFFGGLGTAAAETAVPSVRVEEPPVVDGAARDGAWQKAKPVKVRDRVAETDITLRSVHTEDTIYFLVRYADAEENRLHKPWVWNPKLEIYEMGPQREDTFVFKWNMMEAPVNLSNFSDDSYTADIWYWKANRTDPAGYADDKTHVLSDSPGKKATELVSRSGRKRYLMRPGDEGNPAQKKRVLTRYQGDLEDQFEPAAPSGSAADIRARGTWQDGFWTIEFARKLKTGHADDIQFSRERGKYMFGVSIFGLYGEPIYRSQPHLYGQGRISDPLFLIFE